MRLAMPKNLIAIIGNTGVGKSQLSIDIAKAVNGEIINGDSMQVYAGLNNITNKHPVSERQGIPHHLLGHVPWSHEYSVKQFEEEASKLVDEITARGKVPILVGGTHYYIQTLLFKNSTVSSLVPLQKEDLLTEEQLEILNSTSVFEELEKVDPVVAKKFHPNDTRRVMRALEIFYTTGNKASDIYASQKQENSVNTAAQLRFRSLVFWVWCDKDVLNKRLDDRVIEMTEHGLYDEVREMYNEYQRLGGSGCVDLERGIWQVIGYKQLLPWLSGQDATPTEGIARMQQVTRKYATKQTKWISKKLLGMLQDTRVRDPDKCGDIALLDSSDLSNWSTNVGARGVSIAEDFLAGAHYQKPLAPEGKEDLLKPRSEQDSFGEAKWKHFVCETCLNSANEKTICVGQDAWDTHINSRRHKLASSRKKKRLEKQEQELSNSSSLNSNEKP